MVTIRIKEQSSQAKAIIQMLKAFSFVEFVDEKKPNATTRKAFKEVENGEVIKAKNARELIEKLNS